MTPETKEQENLEKARQVIEWFNARDVPSYIDSLAEGVVWKTDGFPPPGEIVGKEQVRLGLFKMYQVFPDIQARVEHSYTSGNDVISIVPNWGARTRGFMGLEPTYSPWSFDQCIINTFDDQGKILKNWVFWNPAYLLQQLGAIPETLSIFGPTEGAQGAYQASRRQLRGPLAAMTEFLNELLRPPLRASAHGDRRSGGYPPGVRTRRDV